MSKKIVILLSGEINSGKNHAYSVLEELFRASGEEVHHIFFARKLKELCEYTFERYVSHLNTTVDQLIAKSPSAEVSELAESLKIAPHNWYEDKTESTRLILQDMGTRFARENVDDEFWPKKVVDEIRSKGAKIAIATDFRFPNEHAVLVRDLPAEEYTILTLRINRQAGNSSFVLNHPSEQALSEFSFDALIDNSGSLEAFDEKIDLLYKESYSAL